jgi:hypothetical protein
VWGTLAVVMAIGCNPLATISFLTQKDPKVSAEYPLTFKDGPKKNKDEIVVAMFVTVAPGSGPLFAGVEGKLAGDLAKKLPEMAKEYKQKIVVREPAQVNRFKMNNKNWNLMSPAEWGRKLDADYVIEINLKNMSLYQPGSLNNLYEGHAEVEVSVYDVDAGAGDPKYSYVHPYSYPRTGMLDATTLPVNRFKQDFMEHLATELAMKHVDHKQGSGIAEGSVIQR